MFVGGGGRPRSTGRLPGKSSAGGPRRSCCWPAGRSSQRTLVQIESVHEYDEFSAPECVQSVCREAALADDQTARPARLFLDLARQSGAQYRTQFNVDCFLREFRALIGADRDFGPIEVAKQVLGILPWRSNAPWRRAVQPIEPLS